MSPAYTMVFHGVMQNATRTLSFNFPFFLFHHSVFHAIMRLVMGVYPRVSCS